MKVKINQEKIDEDEKWDGLKGYITNTSLPAKEVYEQYNGLWIIERAYRVTKGTLEMRPMFHFTPCRIEAHVCICFVAYKVYELERILKISGIDLSVDKIGHCQDHNNNKSKVTNQWKHIDQNNATDNETQIYR